MEVADAVRQAKIEFKAVFEAEMGFPPTLEEVWFDESADTWSVTLGLRRQRRSLPEQIASPLSSIQDVYGLSNRPEFKVVVLSNTTGKLIAIKDREFVKAA
jgi:hypothetical protein